MKLRIVTVTSRPANPWLAEALESVRSTMPADAEHLVVRSAGTPAAWNSDLWAACAGAEAVAVVDDDDRVTPGALTSCVRALENTGVGLAFTDEEEIDEHGQHLRDGLRRGRCLMDLAMHPRCIHHLAVFRPALVPHTALELAQRCERGLDWLMRAAAGLRGGAVRVPVIGYQWRRHGAQDSSAGAGVYAAAMPALRQLTRSWMSYDAPIREVAPCALG